MRSISVALSLALFASGCQQKAKTELAPVASGVMSATASTPGALKASVVAESSQVTFQMNAPIENIYGEVKQGVSGELFLDPKDLTKTTGNVRVDLRRLELFQEKRPDEQGEFGPRVKNATQNEHARDWLEIGDSAPAEVREKNAVIEFGITGVKVQTTSDVTQITGDTREVMAEVTGDFVLHQRKAVKTAKVKVRFTFEGDRPTALRIESLEPFAVSLEEHDVRPRSAFGKLAEATLDTLAPKVDKTPKVSLVVEAKLVPMP